MKTNAAAFAEQARAKVRHRALARHRDKIVTQAKSAEDIDKIKYQDQGNEELNTEEAFEAQMQTARCGSQRSVSYLSGTALFVEVACTARIRNLSNLTKLVPWKRHLPYTGTSFWSQR